jgi:hypothetical protein
VTAAPARPVFEDDYPTGPLPLVDRPTQPRDAAGRYGAYAELPPPPERVQHFGSGGAAYVVYADTGDRYTPVPAPKCAHGHFARWAAKNCKPCQRSTR